ncbi:iron-containing redox enzyme family protein [Dactylosporangium sp. NBC_01737]|uniref:iron-containing redox enzyme family protein n=1 Tax=Dactylosporangium sp. NBC_01737 TaxID=2975959 RepID=UPI002E1459FE|nr:iron-containing redox enzyme family protein [Dactylosporangium sp. NBC_01737]
MTVAEAVERYCGQRLFQAGPEVVIVGNPYRRTIGLEDLADRDFARPVTEAGFLEHRHLVMSRILCNAYESSMILLPEGSVGPVKADFDAFYGDEARRLRDAVWPDLERCSFGFLRDAAATPPVRTLEELRAWFMAEVNAVGSPADGSGNNPEVTATAPLRGTMLAITQCRHAEEAAALYLFQLGLDALTEASAMARNLGGSYGPEQSELFKIFIDEFGYGVHSAKHSTIFRGLLRSIGLHPDVHAYWNFYLTSSLAGTSYFNHVSENHAGMFRYMGAVTYLEWLFAQGFADMGTMLRAVFGDRVDTRYCDEHAHIDIHHGRMTFEHLLLGFARVHGDAVIPDLVRGVEETKVMMRLGEEDFLAQIRWADNLDAHTTSGVTADGGETRHLKPDSPFVTRVYDEDTALVVGDGEVDVYAWATQRPHRLRRGDALHVPRGRLHGLKAATASATVTAR